MGTRSPLLLDSPPAVRIVEIDVIEKPGDPPVAVQVIADSPEEAYRILYEAGRGAGGAGAQSLYYGSVLEPIRDAYKARLEQVESEIIKRRTALGAKATEYELRGLAQWAARQRANVARVWRMPTPSLLAGLEVRDWQKYGAGGRTFENLLKRNAESGRTGVAAYRHILGSAVTSNVEVNASVARGARFMRGGGAVLGVVGLSVSAYQIYQAPPGQRVAVAERSAVGFAGGLIGAEVGAGLLAVGAGLLAATPPGWIVIGVGLIAGVIGSIIADRIFYPPQHDPIAQGMSLGYAIDPRHPARYANIANSGGSTLLPVIEQVALIVQRGDTQALLSRRAQLQAALSVGLPQDQANAYADRNTSTGLRWSSGDPSPRSDTTVRASDISATVGTKIVFKRNATQRAELATLTSSDF